MKLRVGLPLTGGALVREARAAGHAVLFSANAFFNGHGKADPRAGDFKNFRAPDFQQLEGLDAALDSAGYVAAVKYGDYRWSPEAYMDLAQSFPWAWYASMDYCCEPQVSRDRPLRILRMAATANMLGRLNRIADERGMARPMPVIQGWTAAEYIECARQMPLTEWPDLVGLGSVCRRHLHGPDGLFTIIDALDRELPPHVQLHLFGVKSTALKTLAAHPRIASSDSMAWDFGARTERRTGRDMAFRAEKMHEWADKQGQVIDLSLERAARAEAAGLDSAVLTDRQAMLFPPDEFPLALQRGPDAALEALALSYADLILSSNLDYSDAKWWSVLDAHQLVGRIQVYGLEDAVAETALEMDGFGAHFERIVGAREDASAVPLPDAEQFAATCAERMRA